MPQLDISTFPPQLFWLLITFIALYLVVWKIALPRIVAVRDSRHQKIEEDLEKAETLRGEALAVLVALEKAHADAASEAQSIYRETAQKIGLERLKLQEKTAVRLAEESLAAEIIIKKEYNSSLETIPEIASDLAQAAVERLIGVQIADQETETAIESAMRRDT